MPSTDAPRSRKRRAVPSKSRPTSRPFPEADQDRNRGGHGRSDFAKHGCGGLGEIGLQDQGIDAAVDQDRRLFGGGTGLHRRCRTKVADHPVLVVRTARRASSTARRLIVSTSASRPNLDIQHRLAPKVLVKIASAPAATSRRWIARTSRGMSQVPERRVIILEVQTQLDESRADARVQNQRALPQSVQESV